jgi:hypothetical protein
MKLRSAVVLLVAPLIFGCSDDDPAGPSAASVAGTYSLRTVNGQALPFLFVDQPGLRVEVISDQYMLNANGTFTTTITLRETEDTVVTTTSDSYSGQWLIDGNNINLTSAEVGREQASFSNGNTLTFALIGVTLVYQK